MSLICTKSGALFALFNLRMCAIYFIYVGIKEGIYQNYEFYLNKNNAISKGENIPLGVHVEVSYVFKKHSGVRKNGKLCYFLPEIFSIRKFKLFSYILTKITFFKVISKVE